MLIYIKHKQAPNKQIRKEEEEKNPKILTIVGKSIENKYKLVCATANSKKKNEQHDIICLLTT